MDEDEIRVPVFLITGFLESGKTTFLNGTLRQDYFQMDDTTLLINCEEGECEYDEKDLKKYRTEFVQVGDQEEFTTEYLRKLDKKYRPGRVLLEYNPLWGVSRFEQMELPEGWGILQEIVTVDTSTFQVYMNNMKSLFVDMTRNAELVIFNRADPENQPLANFRRSIKVTNPACQVMFEDKDGTITDIFEDTVPYDLDADPITIVPLAKSSMYRSQTEHISKSAARTLFDGSISIVSAVKFSSTIIEYDGTPACAKSASMISDRVPVCVAASSSVCVAN